MPRMCRAELWRGLLPSCLQNNMETYPFHSSRGCLSYIVVERVSREAALIDPSEEIEDTAYLNMLAQNNLSLRYIIETHTHADHVSSAMRLHAQTGAQIVRHALAPSPHKDVAVVGGEVLPLGSESVTIVATPGHTNESISVLIEGAVFTGDALLIGGTGRTDFQLGDSEALYHSLHDVFAVLDDETIVYPAHDYEGRTHSTIGNERTHNARLQMTHDEFVATMDAHHPSLPELFEVSIEKNSA